MQAGAHAGINAPPSAAYLDTGGLKSASDFGDGSDSAVLVWDSLRPVVSKLPDPVRNGGRNDSLGRLLRLGDIAIVVTLPGTELRGLGGALLAACASSMALPLGIPHMLLPSWEPELPCFEPGGPSPMPSAFITSASVSSEAR